MLSSLYFIIYLTKMATVRQQNRNPFGNAWQRFVKAHTNENWWRNGPECAIGQLTIFSAKRWFHLSSSFIFSWYFFCLRVFPPVRLMLRYLFLFSCFHSTARIRPRESKKNTALASSVKDNRTNTANTRSMNNFNLFIAAGAWQLIISRSSTSYILRCRCNY